MPDATTNALREVQSVIDTKDAEIAALRQDKARLDEIERLLKTFSDLPPYVPATPHPESAYIFLVKGQYYDTLREAIDAAMEAANA